MIFRPNIISREPETVEVLIDGDDLEEVPRVCRLELVRDRRKLVWLGSPY